MSVSNLRRMGVVFYGISHLHRGATASLLLMNEIGQVEMRTKRDISTMLYEWNRRRDAVASPTTTSLPPEAATSARLTWCRGRAAYPKGKEGVSSLPPPKEAPLP
jgi:hypothetical protein